ncbi:MAG: hypothetical protein ACOCUH_00315 [Bacteriovoracia bacterium]
MKSRVDVMTERLLLLLKLDAKNLFNRIKYRRADYITVFALKRTREHFPAIFNNRYTDVSIIELKNVDVDILQALDTFYTEVDDLRWYLDHTEDMPNTVEDNLNRAIRRLEKQYETVSLYIDAALGLIQPQEVEVEEELLESVPEENEDEEPVETFDLDDLETQEDTGDDEEKDETPL